ncbi:MAG: hypothetical protein WBX15_04935 [Thermoanaerobaculia bacterium]
MNRRISRLRIGTLTLAAALFGTGLATAQTPPAKAADDTPEIKIGSTIFADYTYQSKPEAVDADGNTYKPSSFNVTRTYINFNGKLSHRFAFRITPDITRDNGNDSINGSYVFRLKYGFGQFNLDDWTTKGSWIRFGQTQTPYIDYIESAYAYRFQGPVFVDREGFLTSSDLGVSGRWVFPGNYGDVMGGIYNGEGYGHTEKNNQKSLQARVSYRPLPQSAALKGLRFAAFYDADNYLENAKKDRFVVNATYVSSWGHAGLEYLTAKDQASSLLPTVDSRGWSAWITPRFTPTWGALLRHDQVKPDTDTDAKKSRNIAGIAYWIPLEKVTSAIMADYETVSYDNYTASKPDETRFGIHMLINF